MSDITLAGHMAEMGSREVLSELAADLKVREQGLEQLRRNYLSQAEHPSSERGEMLDREQATRLRHKLEGLRLAIGLVSERLRGLKGEG